MWILLAFIAIPMIEITLFIQVGGLIGIWPTLLIVLLTAIIGSRLVKGQGLREIDNLRRSFGEMRDPSVPLAHGAMIVFAGALLLTPGFFTDFLGLLLLIPQVRTAVLKWAASRIKVQSFTTGGFETRNENGDVVDAEFTILDESKRPTHPSGWTKH